MLQKLSTTKVTHWMLWSSPLLLLVLVFTLTTNSTPSASATKDHRGATTRTTSTTVSPPMTTTTTRTPTATTTTTSPPRSYANATTPSSVVGSSRSTDSNAGRSAVASGENARSGALSGQLEPGFDLADVPLVGPGTWFLVTSAPVSASLQCGGASTPVTSTLTVGAGQTCQLLISPTSAETSLTWQVRPTN